MGRWQYFVVILAVLGCSKEPVPEDSYFISIDDYNRLSVDTVQSDPVPPADTLLVVLPDTMSLDSLPADTLLTDSLVILPDSLPSDSLLTDTLEVPADTLQVVSPAEGWSTARLEVRGSLYGTLASITDADPDILGAHCVRYLVWEMNPWNGFIGGDSLIILYDPMGSERENMVMAFEYIPVAGSSNHGFSGFVYKRTGDNWPSVWKPDGTELVKLLDRLPVRTFEEITSVYGEPRGTHTHAGIDFKAPEGTSVYTVTGGIVERTNWNTVYNGNCIEIKFGGYSELSLHLNTIDSSIRPGVHVEPGALIGTVGNTGISTAPHLHYQINDPEGYSIDPYLYFSSHRRTLTENDMEPFRSHVAACRERMGR